MTYITVHVHETEVIGELSSDDLIKEIRRRGKEHLLIDTAERLVHDAHDALMRGRPADALASLERLLFPKFRSHAECERAYKERSAA